MNNSDWVKQGLDYVHEENSCCPFCQQTLDKKLLYEIKSYFDENYEKDCIKLKELKKEYENEYTDINLKLNRIIDANVIIDLNKINQFIENLKNLYKDNISIIEKKIKSPSEAIELKSLNNIIQEINSEINDFNNKIEKNNSILENLAQEKKKVISQIWKYIIDGIKINIDSYNNKKISLNEGKETINRKITEYESKNIELEKQIIEKESEITSVKPTVTKINNILTNFGFTGFKLEEGDEKGTYKIIRDDGVEVNKTLSEGEYNFITFLYFYQLVRGSIETEGLNKPKIVVIDDPISSLDSNVLFIVSTLVREIIADCKKDTDNIKQIFILTHNVYFHNEVTYKSRGEKIKMNHIMLLEK